MRIKNSLRNMIASFSSNILTIFIGLVAQKMFIQILGSEYLGLNSLFSNIITMLSVVEMGVGSAIIYNLYKPIADQNVNKIKSLMQFYKKSYTIIGIVVTFLGILVVPFIPYIVDVQSVSVNVNIYVIYFLFLADTVFSYFLSYKRCMLYANQKNYLLHLIHIGYTILLNVLQLSFLYFTKNYYLYLIIRVSMRVVENLGITLLVNHMYPYLRERKPEKLDSKTERDILKKVKALFFHKIGSIVVLGTDNIIISKFLGLVSVGLYSNYYLIINSVQTVFNQIIQATTASIGNMLVTDTTEKHFLVFKRIRFLNFWISSFSSISILVIMDSFIRIWLGAEFILPVSVLIVLVVNYFLASSRATYASFKEAAGIYYEDRFVPLAESIINIVASIVLVQLLGLCGVFIGTILSGLVLWCFSYPKYVYKKLFQRDYKSYIKETLGYFGVFLVLMLLSYGISVFVVFENIYFEFISNLLIAVIIPNLCILLLFWKSEHMKFYLHFLKRKKAV